MALIIGLTVIFGLFLTAAIKIRWFIYFLILLGVIPLFRLTGGEKNLFLLFGGINISGIRLIISVALMSLYVLGNKRALKYVQEYKFYFLFLIVASFSLVYSPLKLEGLRLLFKLAYPFLSFIIVLTIIKEEKQIDEVVKVILVTGILATFFVLVNIIKGTAFVQIGTVLRLTGAFGRNVHCYHMGILSLLCYAWYYHTREKRKIYLFFLMVFLVQAVLTLSRIGIFSLFFAILFIEIIQKNWGKVIFLSILFFIGLYPLRHKLMERFFRSRILKSKNVVSAILAIDTQGRDKLWKPVIDNISTKNIIQGHGLGSTYVLTAKVKHIISNSLTLKPELHNDWLKILYETGLVGLLAFIFFVIHLIRKFLKIIKFGNLKNIPQINVFSLVAVGGLIQFLITMFVDNSFNNYDTYAMFVWVIAALSIRTYQIYTITR